MPYYGDDLLLSLNAKETAKDPDFWVNERLFRWLQSGIGCRRLRSSTYSSERTEPEIVGHPQWRNHAVSLPDERPTDN